MNDTEPLNLDAIESDSNEYAQMRERLQRHDEWRAGMAEAAAEHIPALIAEVRRLREEAGPRQYAPTFSPHVLGANPAGHAQAHGQSEAAYHSACIDDTGYSHTYPGRLSIVQCQWCTRAFAAHTKDEAMALFREHEKEMLA